MQGLPMYAREQAAGQIWSPFMVEVNNLCFVGEVVESVMPI